jgi:hypothetical protein
MARHSISEAARLAGISRTAFYEHHINKGTISVPKDERGKKYIDTAELLRAFPNIRIDSQNGQVDRLTGEQAKSSPTTQPVSPVGAELLTQLARAEERARQLELRLQDKDQVIRDRDTQIAEYRERETRLMGLLEDKTAKPEPPQPPKRKKFLGLF